MLNFRANNVVRLFDRQPYEPDEPAPQPDPAPHPDDNLGAYAEIFELEAKCTAELAVPAIGVARKSKPELTKMVAADLRDAMKTLDQFRDGAATARVLYEALHAAEAKLSLAIHAATYQQITGA